MMALAHGRQHERAKVGLRWPEVTLNLNLRQQLLSPPLLCGPISPEGRIHRVLVPVDGQSDLRDWQAQHHFHATDDLYFVRLQWHTKVCTFVLFAGAIVTAGREQKQIEPQGSRHKS